MIYVPTAAGLLFYICCPALLQVIYTALIERIAHIIYLRYQQLWLISVIDLTPIQILYQLQNWGKKE